MEKENRYLVIKRSDLRMAEKLLTPEAFSALESLEKMTNQVRVNEGKHPLLCVVVEHDWPEYEPVWESIKKRVEHVAGAENELVNVCYLPVPKQQLLNCGLNVFGIDLLAESFLKLVPSPPDKLDLFWSVNREDCKLFSGINLRIEPVLKEPKEKENKEHEEREPIKSREDLIKENIELENTAMKFKKGLHLAMKVAPSDTKFSPDSVKELYQYLKDNNIEEI